MFDLEDLANLPLGNFGRRRCQSDDSGVGAKLLPNHLMQHEVSRPEVVRPLGCAVDLIDADHADLAAELRQVLDEKPLRRDE